MWYDSFLHFLQMAKNYHTDSKINASMAIEKKEKEKDKNQKKPCVNWTDRSVSPNDQIFFGKP